MQKSIEDPIEFWPQKLTLKTENVQFLTIFNQNALQDNKNPLKRLIQIQKSIEFQLHH